MSLTGLKFTETEFMKMPTTKRRRYYNLCIQYNQKQEDDMDAIRNKKSK